MAVVETQRDGQYRQALVQGFGLACGLPHLRPMTRNIAVVGVSDEYAGRCSGGAADGRRGWWLCRRADAGAHPARGRAMCLRRAGGGAKDLEAA